MTPRSGLLFLLALLGIAPPAAAQTVPPLLPADGLADPVFAFGLTGIADWGTNRPFIDQMLTARPWFGAAAGEWQTISTDDLISGGYVDDEGWVTHMPPGINAIRTIWAYPDDTAGERAGTYILTYDGEGSIALGGDVRRIDARPGRIVFSTEGGAYWLDITEIDPRGVGRPIRNISIVREQDIPLHEAGVIFRPEWLSVVKDARVLRFMTWSMTNGSPVLPGEQPLIEARGFWRMKQRDVPLSLMVELANLVGAEPWFCMPHRADDDYVRTFADYVLRELDPGLIVHVEYSNEVWNEAFPQGRWVREEAAAQWGIPYGHEGGFAFTAREATRDALIWEDVFGVDATTRLDNVLATQVVNAWGTGILLDPVPWADAEPDTYLPPSAVFDSLAITTYFGGNIVSDETLRAELMRRLAADPADARRWVTSILTDPQQPDTPAANAEQLSVMRQIAEANGLRLVSYEGGQHVHHSFAVPGLTEADAKAMSNFMVSYVRGPEMAALTATNWDVWAAVGQGPYMHLGEVGKGGRGGSFSLYDAPGLSNPTADLLAQRNRDTRPWWDGPRSASYQQGRQITGTDQDNALSGTDHADILLAGAGDDLINPGPGRDHINGGDGTDTVLLPDPPGSITLRTDGPRLVAQGPSGRWTLFSVERLRYPDGTETDAAAP